MELHKSFVNKALLLLASAQCQFKIIEADNTEHGTLAVFRPAAAPAPAATRTRRPSKRPRHTFTDYLLPFITPMKPSESTVIPFGPFSKKADIDSLRSSLAGVLFKSWGKGNFRTHANKRKKCFEITRLDPSINLDGSLEESIRLAKKSPFAQSQLRPIQTSQQSPLL